MNHAPDVRAEHEFCTFGGQCTRRKVGTAIGAMRQREQVLHVPGGQLARWGDQRRVAPKTLRQHGVRASTHLQKPAQKH